MTKRRLSCCGSDSVEGLIKVNRVLQVVLLRSFLFTHVLLYIFVPMCHNLSYIVLMGWYIVLMN